jgi:hypothetical protein
MSIHAAVAALNKEIEVLDKKRGRLTSLRAALLSKTALRAPSARQLRASRA